MDEGEAVMCLHEIVTAQKTYFYFKGEVYGTFDQLVAEGFLDKRFAGESPLIREYKFSMQLIPAMAERKATFKVRANPEDGSGGRIADKRYFYLDSAGKIHVNKQRPADQDDPLYDSEPSNNSMHPTPYHELSHAR
jgi:hypothetical protein